MKITIEIGKEKHILKKGNYFHDDHCKKMLTKIEVRARRELQRKSKSNISHLFSYGSWL